jgi:hypothetical protein
MKPHIFSAIIISAIAANGYALFLNYTKPYPQAVITVQGEQTHFVKALTIEQLHRRMNYMGQRGWMCRTSPTHIRPFAVVVMYRPAILRNNMVRHQDGPVEEVLKKWEVQDLSVLKSLSEDRRKQVPEADRVHGNLYLPTPIPEMTTRYSV